MAHTPISILLIIEDIASAPTLENILRTSGYALTVATTLSAALNAIRHVSPKLIALDRKLITEGGIRRDQFPAAIPIIVIQPFNTSCEQDDCLPELDAGFDLVFCSPHYRELIAHIRAILRRQQMDSAPASQLRAGSLVMDIARHEVTVAGAVVELTPKEFQILHQFLLSPGTVLSRQELLNRVWGEEYALEEHALDVHIHSLRQKIERKPSEPGLLLTVRGIGYKLHTT